ncbi:PD-(D/E)XK motif protein [Alistipes putredinis]|uniref:PD-(D/E)XK motif protein n=1 Tax=Alistipes putredinis TaxID=28117 RepID=UPI003C6D479B
MDFNDGIDKIEVKSTSKSHRIHKFSYDQLSPTENTNLIISSIFVIQSGIGKNIFDLKEDIETQICSLELRYKLNEIIFRTLGSEFEKVYDVYFDYQQAVDSYKLIPAIYIPSLNSESIPNEITNIHFDCDLSQIDVPDNIAAIYPHSKLFSSL